MIDYSPNIVTALKTVLPTHYEMKVTSKTPVPCISYMEITNRDTVTGDTIGYSDLVYQVKVWANDKATISKYMVEVDKVMRNLGFKRIGSGELQDKQSTMIQKVLTYQGLGKEEF